MTRGALCIEKARIDLNVLFPNRDKASDGGIGDAAHRDRKSDHNPNRYDVFIARDFDRDGLPMDLLMEHVRTLGSDNAPWMRGGYVIWNRRIAGTHTGWGWRRYGGSNPHTQHGHISVADEPRFYDTRPDWGFRLALASTVAGKAVLRKVEAVGYDTTLLSPVLRWKAQGPKVADIQRALIRIGNPEIAGEYAASYFGEKTDKIVRLFQKNHRLPVTATVDEAFWTELRSALRLYNEKVGS